MQSQLQRESEKILVQISETYRFVKGSTKKDNVILGFTNSAQGGCVWSSKKIQELDCRSGWRTRSDESLERYGYGRGITSFLNTLEFAIRNIFLTSPLPRGRHLSHMLSGMNSTTPMLNFKSFTIFCERKKERSSGIALMDYRFSLARTSKDNKLYFKLYRKIQFRTKRYFLTM